MSGDFPPGSVGHNLMLMRGTWHDHVELFELDGRELRNDEAAGSPGASPFDNLVYIDFDGERMTQTNVTFRGREPSAKTFGGRLIEGILVFDSLGPGAYENVGMSGGPGILIYSGRQVEDAWQTYVEPDTIITNPDGTRLRNTVLYRFGRAVRTLTARGERLSMDCQQRHPWDPRGADGPVHGKAFQTSIWQSGNKKSVQ